MITIAQREKRAAGMRYVLSNGLVVTKRPDERTFTIWQNQKMPAHYGPVYALIPIAIAPTLKAAIAMVQGWGV